jgi:hypothetical protein
MRPSILVLTKPVKVGATSFESPVLMTGGLRVGLVIEGRTSEIQSKASQNDGSRFLQSLPQRRIVLERFVAYLFINCECARGWREQLPVEWGLRVDLQNHIQALDDRLPVARTTVIGVTRNQLCTTEVASARMQKARRHLALNHRRRLRGTSTGHS